MHYFAIVKEGVVWEVQQIPDEYRVEDCFPPDVLATMSPCDASVGQGWTFDGTTYTAPVPTPPPPPTAADILAEKIAAGLTVTCTGDPSFSAVYALDAVTMDQIGSVARDVASGLGFPDGETFTYPDFAGHPHTFTEARLISLYKAQRLVLSRVNTAAAILANGGVPSWPDQTATIP